jgi:hypothetical protein
MLGLPNDPGFVFSADAALAQTRDLSLAKPGMSGGRLDAETYPNDPSQAESLSCGTRLGPLHSF